MKKTLFLGIWGGIDIRNSLNIEKVPKNTIFWALLQLFKIQKNGIRATTQSSYSCNRFVDEAEEAR